MTKVGTNNTKTMSEKNYVISIKRVKNYVGEKLETPEWEYASYDRYAGSMSSGYPCFDGFIGHAIRFASVEEAEKEFPKWFKDFAYGHSRYQEDYDMDSLAIRKITFVTKRRLPV